MAAAQPLPEGSTAVSLPPLLLVLLCKLRHPSLRGGQANEIGQRDQSQRGAGYSQMRPGRKFSLPAVVPAQQGPGLPELLLPH
jgi:hypothetical protein